MDTEKLVQGLYESDTGSLPGFVTPFSSDLPKTSAASKPVSEYLHALDRVSELLAEHLGMEVRLEPDNYHEVMTADVRDALQKKLGIYRFSGALEMLGTLANEGLTLDMMAAAEGLPTSAVADRRSVLIKIGICKRRGHLTDDDVRDRLNGKRRFTRQELKELGVGQTTLTERYGTMQDAKEYLGIEVVSARPRMEDTFNAILGCVIEDEVLKGEVVKRTGLKDDTVKLRARDLAGLGLVERGRKGGKRTYSTTKDVEKAAGPLESLGLEPNIWNLIRYASLPVRFIHTLRFNRSEMVCEDRVCEELGITPKDCEALIGNSLSTEYVSFRERKMGREYRLSERVRKLIRDFFAMEIPIYPTNGLPRIDEILIGPKAIKQRKVMRRYREVAGESLNLDRILSALYAQEFMNFHSVAETLNSKLFGGDNYVMPKDVLEWIFFYGIDTRIEEVIRPRCEEIAGIRGVPFIVRDFISLLPEHRDERAANELAKTLGLAPAYIHSMAGSYMGNGYEEYAEKAVRRLFTAYRYDQYMSEANGKIHAFPGRRKWDRRRKPI